MVFIFPFGDYIGRHLINIPSLMNASCKALACVASIIFVGYNISSVMIDKSKVNDAKHVVSRRWYIWSISGTNITSILFGPLLFNIFLENVYTSPDTSEMVRVVLSAFGVPILFWLLCTAGRFSSYSVAKYGKEDGHIISHKHAAHKAFFVLQFIYSAYMRAMVIGMAGPTDVVGSSITKRWSLIVSAILSCAVTIGTRMTTKARDRFMYKIFHCGRKSLPDDFFENPHVAKFLNRDMLLLETFADITTLTGLTLYTLLFELFIGVDFGDALASAFLNYVIQLLFEQVGNFCIFYFRERKGVFSNEFKEKKGEARNVQADTDDLTKILENLKNVARGTRKLVNETVWFMLLAMPYVTLLLSKLVGGSLTRGLSIEYSVEDYPHDYVE